MASFGFIEKKYGAVLYLFKLYIFQLRIRKQSKTMTTKKSRSIMEMLNACFLTAKVLTIAVQKSDIWVEKKI